MKTMKNAEVKRDKKEGQIQDERQRDYGARFKAERYITEGFCMHFHRNTELYCVNKGQVSVLINGENKILSDGQACVINRLESHSYEVGEPADITYFHVGVQYMDIFYRVHPQNEPARWLLDTAYNRERLFPYFPLPRLKRRIPSRVRTLRLKYGLSLRCRPTILKRCPAPSAIRAMK